MMSIYRVFEKKGTFPWSPKVCTLKNDQNKSCRGHERLSFDDLKLDLEGHLKINFEFLNGNLFWLRIWKGREILHLLFGSFFSISSSTAYSVAVRIWPPNERVALTTVLTTYLNVKFPAKQGVSIKKFKVDL